VTGEFGLSGKRAGGGSERLHHIGSDMCNEGYARS